MNHILKLNHNLTFGKTNEPDFESLHEIGLI